MPDEKQPEIQVTDRRRWTDEGNLREGVDREARPSPPPPPPAKSQAPPPPPQPTAPRPTAPPRTEQPSVDRGGQAAGRYAAAGAAYQKINFERMVLSLAQNAMMSLGLLAPDPSQPIEADLDAGREMIDLLGVLQEKTRGNLTPEEHRILDNTLYELRMAWLELDKRRARAR